MTPFTSRNRLWFLGVIAFLAVGAAYLRKSAFRSESGTLRIHHASTYYEELGYIRLEPPVRLPGRSAGLSKTEVWAKIPEGSWVEVMGQVPGVFHLRFPPGSHLVRVESELRGARKTKWQVADIRGTRLGDGAEWFQVFRPETAAIDSDLVGVEWRRGDGPAQERADDWVARVAANIRKNPEQATQASHKARANNACSSCHSYERPQATQSHQFGPVHRGTDSSGFFVPETLLREEAPLEDYAPREANLADPHVKISCPAGKRQLDGQPPLVQVQCASGRVPVARLDLGAALAAGDERARQVCVARKYLLDHMSPTNRDLFKAEAEICALSKNR